ncbi:MAG TPA: DUF2304 domain-containing protein [Solirubrobacteraceae bacterium]|nr:DUF2304 domain-containing protein [Solirubrobacteraceae bacterium]
MPTRIQLVTILGAVLLLATVLEMVRRRRLGERYALLWLLSAVVLLGLAIWSGALQRISRAIGVIYPPNALFFIAIGCIVLLLLHFSSVLSRLTEQTETLAQRQALLEERLHRQERLAEGASELSRDDDEARLVEPARLVALHGDRGGAA